MYPSDWTRVPSELRDSHGFPIDFPSCVEVRFIRVSSGSAACFQHQYRLRPQLDLFEEVL